MPFAVAKATVDYVLAHRADYDRQSVVWDFIGGEPLLEINLMDRICDYIKCRMYELGHPWFNSYRFSLTTNGLLYGDERVQHFIRKNKKHLSLTMSLDGTRQKHDTNRIFADGSGSYDAVVRNIPLWLQQFPDAATKATVSHEDIDQIATSVIHLWELGLKNINMNLVNEDVWQAGDAEKYEMQLRQLADYMIENKIYRTHGCAFFSQSIGRSISEQNDSNWCGAGRILAVDGNGSFYPCIRFTPFSLQSQPARVIGNCFDGVDHDKLRPFRLLGRKIQSPPQCLDCDVASGCSWCQGTNYDAADNTIFRRAVFTCEMHKARVRANRYFWERIELE